MKKFLRIELPRNNREIPPEVDAAILAYASMRAKSVRRKRTVIKLLLPSAGVAAAAAAVAIIGLTPLTAVPTQQIPAPQTTVAKVQNKVAPQIVKNTIPQIVPVSVAPVSQSDMLALADTTILEQESYNLSFMSDYSLDSDNFTI